MLDYDPYIWSYGQLEKRIGKKTGCQFYRDFLGKNIKDTYQAISTGEIITQMYHEFITLEHGKRRKVQAPCFGEKVVQKILCQIMKPLFEKYFVPTNKASLKNGGVDFARRTVIKQLSDYYRHYGNQGWVVVTDIHHYYDSHVHKILKGLIENYIFDKDFLNICYKYLNLQVNKETGENQGVGIGTEDSQIYSLLYSSPVDHLVVNQLGCKYYSRYMDDSYTICSTYEKAKEVYNKVIEKYHELGLTLNMSKTIIIPLSQGFTFLKIHYKLTDTGKIKKMGGKESYYREKRKLKIFPLVEEFGLKTRDQLINEYKSWKNGFIKYFDGNKFVNETNYLFKKAVRQIDRNQSLHKKEF